MFKILLIVVILIVLGTVFAAVSFLKPKPTVESTTDTGSPSTSDSTASSSGKLLDQIKKINAQASSVPGADPQISTDAHIKLLEDTVTVMSRRLDALEKNKSIAIATPTTSPATTTTSTTHYPVYIPLGGGGNAGDQNFLSLNNYQVTINANDYSGYSGMTLEVSYKSDQNAGPTYARLYNVTDNTAVSSSDASGTSDQNATMFSSSFKLPGGSKTYVLQVKNAAGTNTNFYTARLKVSF